CRTRPHRRPRTLVAVGSATFIPLWRGKRLIFAQYAGRNRGLPSLLTGVPRAGDVDALARVAVVLRGIPAAVEAGEVGGDAEIPVPVRHVFGDHVRERRDVVQDDARPAVEARPVAEDPRR